MATTEVATKTSGFSDENVGVCIDSRLPHSVSSNSYTGHAEWPESTIKCLRHWLQFSLGLHKRPPKIRTDTADEDRHRLVLAH